MLGARPVHLEPLVYASFVVNAETGQTRDGVARTQLLQANDALALAVRQRVLVVGETRPRETHHEVDFYIIRQHELAADRTFYTCFFPRPVRVGIGSAERLPHYCVRYPKPTKTKSHDTVQPSTTNS